MVKKPEGKRNRLLRERVPKVSSGRSNKSGFGGQIEADRLERQLKAGMSDSLSNCTNRIEGDGFYDFHIHTATERYQDLGAKEEHYAEATDRYCDFHGALRCMLNDCGFRIHPGSQTDLFEGQAL
jgi:hypothetical protein